jgi:hypothetical protein
MSAEGARRDGSRSRTISVNTRNRVPGGAANDPRGRRLARHSPLIHPAHELIGAGIAATSLLALRGLFGVDELERVNVGANLTDPGTRVLFCPSSVVLFVSLSSGNSHRATRRDEIE